MNLLEMSEKVHRSFSKLKKQEPVLYAKIVKQHQDDLSSQKGLEYTFWRLLRAASLASAFDIYTELNVNLKLEDCKGETFYSNIPPCTQEEIEIGKALLGIDFELPGGNYYWSESCGLIVVDGEMIGNNGKYYRADDLP